MNILLLKGFNNYFNRIVKRCSTLDEYKNNSASYLEFTEVNFNPNDGIATELVVGGPTQTEGNQVLFWERNGTPDYLVAYETTSYNRIISRWFVLESERTRTGQYRIALKRDVLTEHFDEIMEAPCFIEKGIINDTNNSLLYNNESMTYNQIKTNEIQLKDSTNSGWIVGYLDKNRSESKQANPTVAVIDGLPTEYIDEEDLPFSVNPNSGTTVYNHIQDSLTTAIASTHVTSGGWGNLNINQGWRLFSQNTDVLKTDVTSTSMNAYHGTGYIVNKSNPPETSTEFYNTLVNDGFDSFITNAAASFYDKMSNVAFNVTHVKDTSKINLIDNYGFYTWDSPGPDYPEAIQRYYTFFRDTNPTISSTLTDAVNNLIPSSIVVTNKNLYTLYNNKYVKIGSDYYRMSVTPTGFNRFDIYIPNNGNLTFTPVDDNIVSVHKTDALNSELINVISDYNGKYITAVTETVNSSFIIASSVSYSIVLSRLSTATLNVTIPTNKRHTYDCVADIFAIPYGEVKYKLTSGGEVFTTNRTDNLALAKEIASQFGSSACYDLQLVPYVPSSIVRSLMAEDDVLCLTDLEPENYVTATKTIDNTTTQSTFVLFVSSSMGTFDIPVNIEPKDFGYSKSMNYKLSNETEICRLVSPNFNSTFEFSLAKNDGVDVVNVDYTYKPYTPYIHLNPAFKSLYGRDWNDIRGLICGGDFSLSSTDPAWVNYQNNNKNYQLIFNRQIDNLDFNNQIAQEQLEYKSTVGLITGTLGGIVGGAKAGAKAGPFGAALGAITGYTAGFAGGAVNKYFEGDWLNRQQAEARDYAIDMYGYQLGNIKAQPYSIARSESLTNNHKIFPLIEIYECTDTDLAALYSKLTYNSMTIMAVGQLQNYYNSSDIDKVYLKGQLIRLDTINDDFHIIDAIYQELNKGFYVKAPVPEDGPTPILPDVPIVPITPNV